MRTGTPRFSVFECALDRGGVAFPGFAQRLRSGLRPLVPDCFAVKVELPDDPALAAWRGAAALAADSEVFRSVVVTKQEYEEHGAHICQERFAS